MSTAKFHRCHAVTAKWEGGWSDHPADPGGKTMYGITQAVYHGWLRRKGRSLKPVRQITRAEAEEIYLDNYWLPCGAAMLAAGVDLATYDASVNSGVSRGRKWLMAAIGGTDHETVKRLCAKRLGFVQSLNIWKNFGRGWARRIADVEAKGVAWALAATGNSQVKRHLEDEAEAAEKTARNQEVGAGGSAAGGGGAIAAERTSDIADWIVSGLIILAVAAVIILIVRSRINRERQKAYAREAAAIETEGKPT